MARRLGHVLAIAAALTLPGFSGYGDDTAGRYAVLGSGVDSCGKFVDIVNRDKSPSDVMAAAQLGGEMQWVEGTLSQYNSATPGVYDITAHIGPEAIQLWLFNYCQLHPLENLNDATAALITEFYPHRYKTAPVN